MHSAWRHIWTAFRGHLRHLWLSRGGGYYGLVTALTFVYLEAIDLRSDLAGISHISLSLGWVISFLVGSFVDAVLNGVLAAIWPVHWIGKLGIGLELFGLLGGSYLLFRATRPAILRLLDADDEAGDLAGATAAQRLDAGVR